MPSISEFYESGTYSIARSGKGTTYEEIYHIFDCVNDQQAFSLLYGALLGRDTLWVEGVIVRMSTTTLEPIDGRGFYKATVTWTTPDSQDNEETPDEDGEMATTLEVGTEQFDIRWTEKGKVFPFPPGAPDMHGAIEFDGEEVKGTQIEVPTMQFEEEHIFAVGRVTPAKIRTWGYSVSKVNDRVFRGFRPGEVLLRGISSRPKGPLLVSANFTFAVSPNQRNLRFSDDLKGVDKDGWDFLWISFARDGADPILRPKPLYAYVHEVYDRMDFSDLF